MDIKDVQKNVVFACSLSYPWSKTFQYYYNIQLHIDTQDIQIIIYNILVFLIELFI